MNAIANRATVRTVAMIDVTMQPTLPSPVGVKLLVPHISPPKNGENSSRKLLQLHVKKKENYSSWREENRGDTLSPRLQGELSF
jgi:hypothetical protein